MQQNLTARVVETLKSKAGERTTFSATVLKALNSDWAPTARRPDRCVIAHEAESPTDALFQLPR